MGFLDDPNSPAARRAAEAEARRRADAQAREKKKREEKLEKQRREERMELQRQQREEDEKAINEMAKKFSGNQNSDAKASTGLNRGPGLGSGTKYSNPNVQLGQGFGPGSATQPGFNPNAPRVGHEDEATSAKGGKSGGGKDAGPAVPRLPRPF